MNSHSTSLDFNKEIKNRPQKLYDLTILSPWSLHLR